MKLRIPILLLAGVILGGIGVSAWGEGAWEVLAELPAPAGRDAHPGLAGAFAGAHNGALLVAGGANFSDAPAWEGGQKVYYKTIYALAPNEEGALIWYPQTVAIPLPLAYGVSISTEYGLVCIGGETPDATGAGVPSDAVFVLSWNAETHQVSVGEQLIAPDDDPEEILPFPKLSVPTAHMAGVEYNSRVYIVGGTTPGGYADKMWYLHLDRRVRAKGTDSLSPSRLIWRSLPTWEQPKRSHCLAVVQNDGLHDCIWVMSGRYQESDGSWQFLTDAHKYNLQTRTWLLMGDVSLSGEEARCVMAGSAVAQGFGNIFVLGGANGGNFKKLAEDFPQRISAARAAGDLQHVVDMEAAQKDLLTTHPGFSREILQYSALTDSWEVAGVFPDQLPITAAVVPWGDEILLVGGEVSPGVCAPKIWRGKVGE